MNVSGFGQTKRVIRLYKNPNRTNNPDEWAFPVRQDFVSRKRDGTDEPTTNHWCNAISRCSKRKLLDAARLFQRDFTGRRIAADVAFDDRCQPDCTALSFVRWHFIDGRTRHPAGIIWGRTASMLWRMQSGTGHDGIALSSASPPGISTSSLSLHRIKFHNTKSFGVINVITKYGCTDTAFSIMYGCFEAFV